MTGKPIELSKSKGDLLEKIVVRLCSGYKNAKVTRNAIVKGKSGTDREIDVLIEAQHQSFDIRIAVEAKNYKTKVDVGVIEAFVTKLKDVGCNLGVVVCPLGFTEGALNTANMNDIQLYQVFDHLLGNNTQLIPLRYVVPEMQGFQVQVAHSAIDGGRFALPVNPTEWRLHIKDKVMNVEQAATYAWNNDLFPQKTGEHKVEFGVIKVSPSDDISKYFYLEFSLMIRITEKYYLKFYPSSFMKNVNSGNGNHQLGIDLYSKDEDMLKAGWKEFASREEMDAEALPLDTSDDVRGLIFTSHYTIEDPDSNKEDSEV